MGVGTGEEREWRRKRIVTKERERERESNGLGVCGREMKNGRVELTVLRAFGGFVD